MDNITKHLERIDKAIDLLKRNKDKVKKAKENLVAIEKLENDLSISKKTIDPIIFKVDKKVKTYSMEEFKSLMGQ